MARKAEESPWITLSSCSLSAAAAAPSTGRKLPMRRNGYTRKGHFNRLLNGRRPPSLDSVATERMDLSIAPRMHHHVERALNLTMAQRIGSMVIEGVEPELDCGRFAVKRVVGDSFRVRADIFKE